MSNLITKEFQGNVFNFREDGYFNMTAAAKAFGKRIDHFMKSEEASAYINKLDKVLTTPKRGELIAQKVRFQNKEFMTRGDFKNAGLFGQHLWGNEGKKLVITEGEIDCLTVSQLQGNKWPVVSIPNGAQGATQIPFRLPRNNIQLPDNIHFIN